MQETGLRALRNVLGCFATGVAIITTSAENVRTAVTVNSFSSVSLDPPLILFSLAKTANVLTVFQRSASFAVNLLTHQQEGLSNLFARPSSASWEGLDYAEAEDGAPLFAGCLAQMECRKHSEIDGGDHSIFLGEVTRFHLGVLADPLLFYRGRYGTYTRDLWGNVPPSDSSLAELAIPGWG